MKHVWTVIVISLCTIGSALAAEGMWTPDHLPMKELQARYGFAPDAKWVEHVQRSALRLAGGCSGSFVSPDGLVLSNHHCARECVQQLSTAKKDFISAGFYAKKAEDEVMCPQIELNRLDAITDVTARVKGVTEHLSGEAYSRAQKAEKSKIEATHALRRCRAVSRRRLRSVQVPPLPGRAPGVRARGAGGIFWRRSG
jgi:hypothetical protein